MAANQQHDGKDIEHHQQQAGYDPGQEEPADGLLRGDAIDNKYYAGGDKHPQGPPGGNTGGSQAIGIAVSLHLWKGNGPDGGRRGGVGAAHGAENGAGTLGGDGQPTGIMPHHPVGKLVQAGADARIVSQKTHPDEHGYNAQGIGGESREDLPGEHAPGSAGRPQESKAGKTYDHHGICNGDLENQKNKEDDDADYPYRQAAHRPATPLTDGHAFTSSTKPSMKKPKATR